MALTQIDDRGLKTPIDLLDNEKIRLGTGNDLELYHNGSNSIIDSNTGNLEITSDSFYVNNAANNEVQIKAVADGAVELYHDNTLRFLTNSIGAQCQGDFSIPLDNEELRIGAGNDFRVKHDGTNTLMSNNTGALYISGDDIRLTNAATDENYIKGVANGAVELYYDNSKKFSTINAGAYVTGSFGVGAATNPSHNYNQGIHVHATGTGATLHLTDNTSGSGADDGFDVLSNAGEAFLWQRENASMRFGTNATERMRIDSSGNVGIGNTNPSDFHSSGENLVIGSGSGDEGMTVYSGTGNSGIINFADGTSGSDSYEGRILYRHADNAMSFHTNNGSERMRIDSSGNVGIGTTSPGQRLHVYNAATDSTCYLKVENNRSRNAAVQFTTTLGSWYVGQGIGTDTDRFAIYDSADRFVIDSSGHTFFSGMTSLTASSSNKGINMENSTNNGRMNFHANDSAGNASGVLFYHSGSHIGGIYYSSSAVSYNTSSDYRLKENVTAISDGITRLKTLKPSRFNFKVDKDKTVDGFLAHEVTAVPEAIIGTKDEVDSDNKPVYQGIDQSKLVPLLVAALQEAITKIETLETKVATLEAA